LGNESVQKQQTHESQNEHLEYARFASQLDPELFASDEISIATKVMSIFDSNNVGVSESGPFAVTYKKQTIHST